MSTHVAIIGTGLSGLALALSLHQQSIPCTLYEARSAPLNIGGAIMLSPNALRILDTLGVYSRIRSEAYDFDHLYFRSPADTPLDTYEFGSAAKYGYSGMRIYRHVLIRELSAMVAEAGVPIHYHKKFSRVITETESSITWEFEDGTTETATCLVGADGIHSKVRKYLYPELEPKFMNGRHGRRTDGSTRRSGGVQHARDDHEQDARRKRSAQLDREGWNKLMNDKDWCVDFLREGADEFPEIVQRAVSDISAEKINLWPFYMVPKLEKWSSEHSRVVILGDAAHAIPPSAGQGINQAFEDVYTYALILAKCEKAGLQRALKIWQQGRQERVDKVLALNARIDKRRMPKPAGGEEKEAEDEKPFELGWLYKPDFGAMVEEWLARE
ncbi:hypothetical protein CBS147323_4208 [Aspergillus niger]|nr:hypothetical protein CBS147323_4208 [Aspergillus niger]